MTQAQQLDDLRFGYSPVPDSVPGYDPAGDARAIMAATVASPAREAIPGTLYTGSYAPGERFVIRVPQAWNGSLVVAGTPATRSEFANDLIWSEFALARGYAFASSNKGVAFNAFVEPLALTTDRRATYPVPFDAGGLLGAGLGLRIGMLSPQPIPVQTWNADYRSLIVFARDLLTEQHRAPERVYAVGTSNGGAQVRTLLETRPDLVDGGVEWEGVYWSADHTVLDDLPVFLREMPQYVASGFTDTAAADRLVAAGFPPDVRQDDPAHPSLYAEFYSNVPPFYADLTVFAYALLIDPDADAWFDVPACVPNAADPVRLPATCNGRGLATAQNRAAYTPSRAARAALAGIAHTGTIGKPLISIAGTHDVFIPPEHNAAGYARAVAAAGGAARHELFLIEGGTHVDAFVAFGYGTQPQAPFAWAAFDRLVRAVEGGEPLEAGAVRTVRTPEELR